MSLQQLREQRTAAAGQIRQIADKLTAEKRDFNAEERGQWDRANAEYDRLKSQVEREERAEQVRKDMDRRAGDPDAGREDSDPRKKKGRRDSVVPTEEQRNLAFRAWAKRQFGMDLKRGERAACKALRFNPSQKVLRIGLGSDERRNDLKGRLLAVHPTRRGDIMAAEQRAALSAQIGTSGAYLAAPASLASSFELNLLAFGGVRQVSEEKTTQSGEDYVWPTVDDTGNQGEQLGENASVGTGVNPSFGRKVWHAYKFSSKPVLVPSEHLEDDQYNLAGDIGGMLGIRLGRITATKAATGSGSGTFEGIVTGAALGVTAASATSFTADKIIDLIHSIDPAYRSMPGVGFLMHDAIIQYIRKLKDGEGRFIWQPGLDTGNPDKILGYKVNICQEMDSTVATTKKVMLFGELSKYKIRRVREMRLYRLEERYRDLDQDGFIAFIREDGKLLQAGTNPVKYLQMA